MTDTILQTLNPEEARVLQDALGRTIPAGGRPTSLNDLFTRWRTLVNEIERGYKLTAYDYTNDLSARDRIEDVGMLLPSDLRAKVMSAIAPLDERFIAATEEAPHPLSNRPHMWWRRIPRARDPEFDETM